MPYSDQFPFLPDLHATFLDDAVPILAAYPGVLGIAAGGSFLDGNMDDYSDLDLVISVAPESWPMILDERRAIAESLGSLLSAFTGEHVGEPRLLICLFGPPLLHVDLKFVEITALRERVETPVVLWERDGAVSRMFQHGTPHYPEPDRQWIEDRIWVWVHYTAAKIARGEYLEAIDSIGYIRGRVLGPLALQISGNRPNGLRRVESFVPEFAREVSATLCSNNPSQIADALHATVEIYRRLRGTPLIDEVELRRAAEIHSMEYLAWVRRQLE